MVTKDFFEKYPLYRKFDLLVPAFKDDLGDIEKPALHMYCETCESEQTFNMGNEYFEDYSRRDRKIWGETVRAKYICSACDTNLRLFYLYFCKTREIKQENSTIYTGYVMKVGQNPSWEISLDKRLGKTLGAHSSYYKKGLICESQGFGIGAYAYYRRITEEIIDELLDSISPLLSVEEQSKYNAALEKTKKTRVAEEKIELVKDLLPGLLRPGNINPLSVLHGALSSGLHQGSEDECLKQAEIIRSALIFLVNEVYRKSEESKKFTDSMKHLLDKKRQKV